MRSLAQLLEQILPALVDVDAADFLPRNHDVVHRHLTEIEDGQQHLTVALWNQWAGFRHDRAQLFTAERLPAARPLAYTENAQQPVCKLVRYPKKRARHGD